MDRYEEKSEAYKNQPNTYYYWKSMSKSEVCGLKTLDILYLMDSVFYTVRTTGLGPESSKKLVDIISCLSVEMIVVFWKNFNLEYRKASEDWYLNTEGAIPVILNALIQSFRI